ncbi:Rz1-like lysis system protein LysC [Piscirickettsia litoralis]
MTSHKHLNVKPPYSLVKNCSLHKIKGQTVKDVVIANAENAQSIKNCNLQLKHLREFHDNA